MNDPINPNHYKLFKDSDKKANEIEAIDVIQATLTPEEFKGYIKGNMLKYQLRHKNKNGEEDMSKIGKYWEFYNEMQIFST